MKICINIIYKIINYDIHKNCKNCIFYLQENLKRCNLEYDDVYKYFMSYSEIYIQPCKREKHFIDDSVQTLLGILYNVNLSSYERIIKLPLYISNKDLCNNCRFLRFEYSKKDTHWKQKCLLFDIFIKNQIRPDICKDREITE